MLIAMITFHQTSDIAALLRRTHSIWPANTFSVWHFYAWSTKIIIKNNTYDKYLWLFNLKYNLVVVAAFTPVGSFVSMSFLPVLPPAACLSMLFSVVSACEGMSSILTIKPLLSTPMNCHTCTNTCEARCAMNYHHGEPLHVYTWHQMNW